MSAGSTLVLVTAALLWSATPALAQSTPPPVAPIPKPDPAPKPPPPPAPPPPVVSPPPVAPPPPAFEPPPPPPPPPPPVFEPPPPPATSPPAATEANARAVARARAAAKANAVAKAKAARAKANARQAALRAQARARKNAERLGAGLAPPNSERRLSAAANPGEADLLTSALIYVVIVAAILLALGSMLAASLPLDALERVLAVEAHYRSELVASFVDSHRLDIALAGAATLLVAAVVALPMVMS